VTIPNPSACLEPNPTNDENLCADISVIPTHTNSIMKPLANTDCHSRLTVLEEAWNSVQQRAMNTKNWWARESLSDYWISLSKTNTDHNSDPLNGKLKGNFRVMKIQIISLMPNEISWWGKNDHKIFERSLCLKHLRKIESDSGQ